jgi:hypothetical protein
MKRLFGIWDEDGSIYAVFPTIEETGDYPYVELTLNFTDDIPDWTDLETGDTYITVGRLAKLFNDLCKRSGMKKSSLAILCGVTASTFSRYCSGITPVPLAIWRIVDIEARSFRGKTY